MMEAGHTEKYKVMILTKVIVKYQASLRSHQARKKGMYRNKMER